MRIKKGDVLFLALTLHCVNHYGFCNLKQILCLSPVFDVFKMGFNISLGQKGSEILQFKVDSYWQGELH